MINLISGYSPQWCGSRPDLEVKDLVISLFPGEGKTWRETMKWKELFFSFFGSTWIEKKLRRPFETIDISPQKDGTLLKKLLSAGDGHPVNFFDEVTMQVDQVTVPGPTKTGQRWTLYCASSLVCTVQHWNVLYLAHTMRLSAEICQGWDCRCENIFWTCCPHFSSGKRWCVWCFGPRCCNNERWRRGIPHEQKMICKPARRQTSSHDLMIEIVWHWFARSCWNIIFI